MSNINFENINMGMYTIKMFLLQIYVYMMYAKIINYKITSKKQNYLFIVISVLNSFLISILKYKVDSFFSVFYIITSLGIITTKFINNRFIYNFLLITISLSINYILNIIGIIIVFIMNTFYIISNDYINFALIIFLHTFFLVCILRARRIKNGISFLNNKSREGILNIIILNISSTITFCFIILSNGDKNIILSKRLIIAFIIFSIIMFLTIKKSIEAYYKQKLLIQDLNETKKELEEKKKEIEELEAENLNFSKKSHSLAHKQKSLEFKINKLLMNSENANELGLENDLKNLSKELYENSKLPQLEKTGITEIDDMLSVMQEECRINGIDFSLQLKGNIYQMTNNFVTKEELSILLADHIKDAIIAIKHTDNINKSIMVRLGKIDENFGLYIYDSGIEFPKEVLENLGKKPITTYSDEDGTGMGFMNTFDTLKKHNASLIIESIGKPSKDNYTKVIKIIFDNKCQKTYK